MQVLPLMKRLQDRHWSGPGPQQPSLEHSSLHTIPSAAAERRAAVSTAHSPPKAKGEHSLSTPTCSEMSPECPRSPEAGQKKTHKITIMPQHKHTEHSAEISYTLLVCSFQKKMSGKKDIPECCKDNQIQRRAAKTGINRDAASEVGEKGHDSKILNGNEEVSKHETIVHCFFQVPRGHSKRQESNRVKI